MHTKYNHYETTRQIPAVYVFLQYCNITNSAEDVKGGCQCPDGFTCTESHTERIRTGYWRRKIRRVTYSKCERDDEEPKHFVSIEYLCYGSTVIINSLILSAMGSSTDVRF